MSDIVERLRYCADKIIVGPLDWLGDAADEIESLRQELEFVRNERDAARADAQCARAEKV